MSKKQLDELLGLESFTPLSAPETIMGGENVKITRTGDTKKVLTKETTVIAN